MKTLTNPALPYTLSPDTKNNIVKELFPLREDEWEKSEIVSQTNDFTYEELTLAGDRIKPGKSPGPDGIPPEVAKMITKEAPDVALSVFNKLLSVQAFPPIWKQARLVLLPKGSKSLDVATAFRPLCLLNTLGKLYECLI
nr:unnamed protein product [Callosobruchus analis]